MNLLAFCRAQAPIHPSPRPYHFVSPLILITYNSAPPSDSVLRLRIPSDSAPPRFCSSLTPHVRSPALRIPSISATVPHLHLLLPPPPIYLHVTSAGPLASTFSCL